MEEKPSLTVWQLLLDIAVLGPLVVLSIAIVALIVVGIFQKFQPILTKSTSPTPTITPQQPTIAPTITPTPTQVSTQSLSQAHNLFGLNILKKLTDENKEENVVISPTSLSIAFTMLYNGASGETKAVLDQALGYSEKLQEQDINKQTQELINSLQNSDVTLSIANSIWIRDGFPVISEFTNKNKEYLNALVSTLDFSKPSAPTKINNWVKDNTNNKIVKIVSPPLPDSLMMMLVNAVYFKGTWTYTFDKEYTNKDTFYLTDGTTQTVSFMHQTRKDFKYFENDTFQTVLLPYGEGKRFAMSVLVPKEEKSAKDIINGLNPTSWQEWMNSYNEQKGTVALPKFKLEYSKGLIPTLQSLGLENIFSDNADFSLISEEPLKVGSVLHKTFIEVDEQGTEAAAVTSIGIVATSAVDNEPSFSLVANKPFVLAITDTTTNEILFIGLISNPLE